MAKVKIITGLVIFSLVIIAIKFLTPQLSKPIENIDLNFENKDGGPSATPLIQMTNSPTGQPKKESEKATTDDKNLKFLKDVGEPYLDFFGLKDNDFKTISEAGFNTIESNFDICASDKDVSFFLNKADEYGLKVIMPAGAGEAEWGYQCDKTPAADQKPIWQKEAVQNWINKWKDHAIIYAWDTSNEAGSVFPNADKEYYLTVDQLREAYQTVKEADPDRLVMTRMNGWFFYDYDNNFFRHGNPFADKTTDIVMVNAYSNVEDYFYDFVSTVTKRAVDSIGQIDPSVKFIVSLGVWEESPLWFRPSVIQIENDYQSLKSFDLLGTAYFKYGAKGSKWYLPEHISVWEKLRQLNLN